VDVLVTNNTGQPATLAGWIDLDGNGTFDPDELETITVPANSGAAEYELSFGVPQASGNTYARFRLFPGDVSDPLATGAASGGEVEDYPVAFVAGPPIFLGCSARVADVRRPADRLGRQHHGRPVASRCGTPVQ